MQNVKCSLDNRQCPDGLDICCLFCRLNYAPCIGKCSGCWDDIPELGYVTVSDRIDITQSLPSSIA